MKEWMFPTGEYGIIVDDNLIVNWNWKEEKDVFKICSQLNALSIKYPYERIFLNVPYFPYSRQDKIFNIGESLGFELLLKLLSNSCNKKQLTIKTLGIHNKEAANYYSNSLDIFLENKVFGVNEIHEIIFNNGFTNMNVIFPDKNANNHFYGEIDKMHSVYTFKKLRNNRGEIISYECEKIKNIKTSCVIFDDICDGGATFIKCAESLTKMGINNIALFVYHGFFTKGIQPLLDAGIKHIYTTNSVCNIEHKNLTIIDLEGNENV